MKLRFNYRSELLGHYVDVTVVIPTQEYRCNGDYFRKLTNRNPHNHDEGKPHFAPGMKFQTVYLIHGGGDDDTLPYRFTNVEEAAERNHVMLVSPNITNSFGINTRYGVRYMDFVCEELPIVLQTMFPSSPAREDNFIMGFAMGGNAALGMAVNHPELYAACIDMSGGIGMTFCPETLAEEIESDHFRLTFPLFCTSFGPSNEIIGSEYDLRAVTKRHQENGTKMPDFTVVLGTEEFIRERVEADVRAMQELNLDPKFILVEGADHDFKLWNEYLQKALDELLPLKRAALTED
ncbi:MAG: hypothetical protein IJL78_07195 [Lachnospiraceae bacterium]|nr:hypothetical protein [Lachnospiraceae bacterium]